MNWTNLQEIEEKIVEKRYSDKEAFHYLLGTAIIYTLSYFLWGEEYENGYKIFVNLRTLCTQPSTKWDSTGIGFYKSKNIQNNSWCHKL